MALNLTKSALYLALILSVSAIFNTEARRLNDNKPRTYIGLVYLDNITDDIYKGIGGIKASGGPSPGGKGHNIPNSETLGERKNPGPSPRGKGHDQTNVENLGHMKNFGAAKGGNGHGFVNADILGEIKNSGPAPGGKGH